MYYTRPLNSGETTPNVIDTLKIDSAINNKVTKTVTKNSDGSETITTSYTYNEYEFRIEIEVDAVQSHNAQDAIKSAWGADVNIASDGTLSLK